MMLNLEKNKIGKEFHPFKKETFGLELNEPYGDAKTYEDQAKKILKYAPRSMDFLQFRDWRDGKLVNALKRVKKVRLIFETSKKVLPNQWRLILQNKFKSIEEFEQGNDGRETLEKYKTLFRLSKVKLWGHALFPLSFFRYMPGMTNLKSFSLKIDFAEAHPQLLKRLNSMSKALCSLKTVELSCLPVKDCKPKISFHAFMRNQNIEEELIQKGLQSNFSLASLVEHPDLLEAVTHLIFRGVAEDNFSSNFELLPAYCKRLVSLRLDLPNNKESLSIVKLLKDFGNLREISITPPEDLFPFLDYIAFPPLVQNVYLYFKEVFDSIDQPESLLDSPEETLAQDSRLSKFFEQWDHLKNLNSLNISFRMNDPKATSKIFAFMNLILRRIPRLVNFYFDLLDWSSGEKRNSIDLTSTFQALQRFSDRLEMIRFYLSSSSSITWPSKQEVNFPKLIRLELPFGPISDLSTIQNIFGAFTGDYIEIFLSQFTIDSNQALLDLLQVLRNPPSNSKVSIEIVVEKLDLEKFDEIFKEFIEEAKKSPIVKDFTVKIKHPLSETQLRVLYFLYQIFEHVEFESEKIEASESQNDDLFRVPEFSDDDYEFDHENLDEESQGAEEDEWEA